MINEPGDIRFMIKKLESVASNLSYGDLKWADRMSDAFNTQGFLTDNQFNTLLNIYEKHRDD